MNSQEEQFQRLGRELHDHIGQDLTAININVSLIERMLPENSPEGLQARLSAANQLVEESVARMRNIMSDFVPPMLDRYGLAAALLWYGQKITKRTNMPVQVDDSSLHNVRLPAQVEIVLFRIAQEALDNIVRHTQASLAQIELKDEAGFILMSVTDNGAGFDPQAVSIGLENHWGLAMMRERAREIDALFSIESAPGAGTKVLLRVPRKP
jgi:two-component system sensor histidine kinase UhpB